jgi:cytochrome c556
VLAFLCTAGVHADEQDDIDYRQHIMKTMGEQTASMNMILQHKVPADGFIVHAKVLAIAAAMAKKSFDSKADGGNAKPAVWVNRADFDKQMDALTAATDDLAKAAAGGGVAAAGAKVAAVTASCNACHAQYMVPKK